MTLGLIFTFPTPQGNLLSQTRAAVGIPADASHDGEFLTICGSGENAVGAVEDRSSLP
jgi:hypothetical protein